MPQEKPTHNRLSKPVEPQFRTILDQTVQDSFEYGVSKYGTELHSFNGRKELQDIAEELVSALRYAAQLDMRCEDLIGIIERYIKSHKLGPGPCICDVCDDARVALE